MKLRRRSQPSPAIDEFVVLRAAYEEARRATMRRYAEGFADGVNVTLRLLLGEAVHDAGVYRGPMPPELEAWARAALANQPDVDIDAVVREALP